MRLGARKCEGSSDPSASWPRSISRCWAAPDRDFEAVARTTTVVCRSQAGTAKKLEMAQSGDVACPRVSIWFRPLPSGRPAGGMASVRQRLSAGLAWERRICRPIHHPVPRQYARDSGKTGLPPRFSDRALHAPASLEASLGPCGFCARSHSIPLHNPRCWLACEWPPPDNHRCARWF